MYITLPCTCFNLFDEKNLLLVNKFMSGRIEISPIETRIQ